jgi:hypothetical protein
MTKEITPLVNLSSIIQANINGMKETPGRMRRITVTSSLNEKSTDQLGNRLGVRG